MLGSDNFFDLASEGCLGYDSSDGYAFWSLLARPTIGAHPTACCLYLTQWSATLDATLQILVPPWLGSSPWPHVSSVDSASRHVDVGGPFFVVQP